MRMDALVSGEEDSPVYKLLAKAVRTLVPKLEKLNIASAAQVRIETLTDRMRKEVLAKRGVVMSYGLVGAWANKPFSHQMADNWLAIASLAGLRREARARPFGKPQIEPGHPER